MQDAEWKELEVHWQKKPSGGSGSNSCGGKKKDEKQENDDGDVESSSSSPEEEEPPSTSWMFGNAQEDKEQLLTISLDDPSHDDSNNNQKKVEIQLYGYTEIQNATGLAVWEGAEVLSKFLLAQQQPPNCLVRGKRILELGAGLGLTGILCATHLHAASVVLTDGDSTVLPHLRNNVQRNSTGHHPNTVSVQCPQLIWGRQLSTFRDTYGTFDVILASDCLYMHSARQPFWKTVQALLAADGKCIFCMASASQDPVDELVAEAENQFGFVSTNPSKDIYIFQRGSTEHSASTNAEQ